MAARPARARAGEDSAVAGLLDPVALHVERARALSKASEAPLVSADVGDARSLDVPDATVDVVLLLGPLYHLTARGDRVKALAEARRVLVEEAGLRLDNLIAVEGPGWMTQDLDTWLEDAAARERLLNVLRRLETESSLIGTSAHMLAVAHR